MDESYENPMAGRPSRAAIVPIDRSSSEKLVDMCGEEASRAASTAASAAATAAAATGSRPRGRREGQGHSRCSSPIIIVLVVHILTAAHCVLAAFAGFDAMLGGECAEKAGGWSSPACAYKYLPVIVAVWCLYFVLNGVLFGLLVRARCKKDGNTDQDEEAASASGCIGKLKAWKTWKDSFTHPATGSLTMKIHFVQEVFEVAVQGWALVTLSQTSLLEIHVLLLAAVICANCVISPALSLAAVTLGGNDVAGRRKRLTWRAVAFATDLFFDYMYVRREAERMKALS